MSRSISIIIPTLNEEKNIEKTITRVQSEGHAKIIVVDGGSSDDTVIKAKSLGCQVLHSKPSRALQMNAGADAAMGDILLFLHADTLLPILYEKTIVKVLQEKDVITGAFQLSIDSANISLRIITWFANKRSRLLQLPYGDQGLFLTKEHFIKAGGFPETPLMEDFELVRKLRKQGMITTHQSSVITSGRRWQHLGIWRTTLLNQMIVAGYLVGIPVDVLAGWYRKGSLI